MMPLPPVIMKKPSGAKKRATSLIGDKQRRILFGRFLKALRHRVGLSAEEVAAQLGFQRSTQVIRREKGELNIPLSDVVNVAQVLRCDNKLMMLSIIFAYHQPIFDTFERALCADADILDGITAEGLFNREIACMQTCDPDKDDLWRGAIHAIRKREAAKRLEALRAHRGVFDAVPQSDFLGRPPPPSVN